MTLMEALLASTLLAMGASAVLLPFTVAAQNEAEDARRTLAVHLARELMEEIISKPFDDPGGEGGRGPEAGESNRTDFDNIDDYHNYKDGYSESISDMVGINGQVIDDAAIEGLHRHVRIYYVYVNGQDGSQDPNFVRIKVRLLYHGDLLFKLSRLVYKPQRSA